MRIALFDGAETVYRRMKEALVAASIRHNETYDLLRITYCANTDQIKQLSSGISVAFLSMDRSQGYEMGRLLIRENPAMFLCYYGAACPEMDALLSSRPYACLSEEALFRRFDELWENLREEMLLSSGIFVYDTRQERLYYPLRSILYFQSDLKYVNVKSLAEHEGIRRIYGKLSDIERGLEGQGCASAFIRIHQSYIAGIHQIRRIDRKEHMIFLSNGEVLPVSKAYYSRVLERITPSGE